MRSAMEVLFAIGVGAAFVGAFGLVMAALSRPWLGRRVSDAPLLDVVTHNPWETSFLMFWRLRRWDLRMLAVGALVAVPSGLVLAAL